MNDEIQQSKMPSELGERLRRAAQRAIAIVTGSKEVWSEIRNEPGDVRSVYLNYLVFLAAIPAICGFIGKSVIGIGVPFLNARIRMPFFGTLISQIVFYFGTLAMLYAVAVIMNLLAPKFGGKADILNSLKLLGYASTPGAIGGIFLLFPNALFSLASLLLAIYGVYLIYQNFSLFVEIPAEKRPAFAGGTVLGAIAAGIVFAICMMIVTPTPNLPSFKFNLPAAGDNEDFEQLQKRLMGK